jgi:hypothetical protein
MAGAQIKQDQLPKQGESFTMVFPDGSEFRVYSHNENQQLVLAHSSGSLMEFKADGSVFINATKDIHTTTGIISEDSDQTTSKTNTDYTWDVGGKLNIKCAELNFEVGSKAALYAGTDFQITGNNIISKATEQVSIEAQKSIYLDSKEKKEKFVTQKQFIGTNESGGAKGGLNVLNVHGNTIIKNDDASGGITLAARGYMNFVCGQERIDLVGSYKYENLVGEQEATWTQKVKIPQNLDSQAASRPGGDYYFMSDASSVYSYAQQQVTPQRAPYGYVEEVNNGDFISNVFIGQREDFTVRGNYIQEVGGNRERKVLGEEQVDITGKQRIKANKIFLN